MAAIDTGYSLTLKQGNDLFTIQGQSWEAFGDNLTNAFGAGGAEAILQRYQPAANVAEAQAKVEKHLTSVPAPQSAPKSSKPQAGEGEATKAQKDLIWKIADEVGLGRTDVYTKVAGVVGGNVETLNDLSKKQASSVIDALKAVNFEKDGAR